MRTGLRMPFWTTHACFCHVAEVFAQAYPFCKWRLVVVKGWSTHLSATFKTFLARKQPSITTGLLLVPDTWINMCRKKDKTLFPLCSFQLWCSGTCFQWHGYGDVCHSVTQSTSLNWRISIKVSCILTCLHTKDETVFHSTVVPKSILTVVITSSSKSSY